jgi:polar amino acid transport system substrate-binding protein
MKTSIGLIIFLFISPAHAGIVSIRADNWFPMNAEPGSKNEGYMIDIAREIFKKAGYTVDYKIMPWKRAIKSVRSGKIDCVVGAYIEDAPDFIFPTENWGMDITGYYVANKSNWTFNGFNSLLDKKVGVINGYSYGGEFDNLVKSRTDVFKASSGSDAIDKNFKKLISNRLDVVVASESAATAKLKELKLNGKIKMAGTNPTKEPLFIACSPAKESSKELIVLVDKGTQALRTSGKLKQILAKYGLKDWK